MASRKSREQWVAVVAAFEQSGDSIAKFCARRRIPPASLKWWRWRLRDARAKSALVRSDDVRLVPVDIIGLAASRPNGVTIALSDLEVRVEVGTDVAYVGALVGELRSRC
jgi:hypothetical protein